MFLCAGGFSRVLVRTQSSAFGGMNPVWSALLGMNASLVDEFLSEIPFSEASPPPLRSFSSFCRQSYTVTLLYYVILNVGFLI